MLTVIFSLCVQAGNFHRWLTDDHALYYAYSEGVGWWGAGVCGVCVGGGCGGVWGGGCVCVWGGGGGPGSEEARWKPSISGQKWEYLTPIVLSLDFSYKWH